MPIYEYECQVCGHHFERMQRFSDDPIQVCPDCAGPVRRLISPAGIIFKGSGWYITDNRQLSNGGKATTKQLAAPKGAKTESASSASDGAGED